MRRNGVQMTADQHTLRPTEFRTGHDGVAVPHHREPLDLAQCALDEIGKHTLLSGLTGHVDEPRGEGYGPDAEVEGRRGVHVATVAA